MLVSTEFFGKGCLSIQEKSTEKFQVTFVANGQLSALITQG
jgi:hypothetical protein